MTMNRLTFLKAAIAGGAVAATGAAVTAAPAQADATGYRKYGTYAHGTDLSGGRGVVHRGGVIRFYDAGPALHLNGTHQSVGIIPSSVKVSQYGDLQFNLDVPLPVVTVNVTEDETLTVRRIKGGLSGGGGLCVVRFFDDKLGAAGTRLNLRRADHYRRIAGATSNVWVGVTSYYAGA